MQLCGGKGRIVRRLRHDRMGFGDGGLLESRQRVVAMSLVALVVLYMHKAREG